MRTATRIALLSLALVPLISGGAFAEEIRSDATGSELIEKTVPILVKFLVLAVVFEVALTPIFNWRMFLRHFEGRGWKTPIAVLLAWLVFATAKLDIFQELMVAFEADFPQAGLGKWASTFVTALLIAGGSDGIFRIFARLGIRNPTERRDKAVAERERPGTLRINIDRSGTVQGPVTLKVDEETPRTVDTDAAIVRDVAPGQHVISAQGTDSGGVSHLAEAPAVMTPGGEVTVDIKF